MDDSHRADPINKAKELLRGEAYGDAETLLSELIRDIESKLGEEAPELITPLYLYAKSISKQHPWNVLPPNERAALERALRIAVALHGEESPRTKNLRETLAVCLDAGGETALAATHMAIVVRLAERVHGDGVLLAHALNGLADMLLRLNRFEEALATYTRAFSMAGDRGHELMDFGILWGQGRCLIGMGRHADAIPFLERALGWCLQTFGERNRVTVEVRDWLERARRGDADS